ncbi:MAG: DEAD/DEAH box helicase family protein [Candidatus Delongbacteria bacterium]|jgi:type I restriction enzyme R subunit|nr:DEAD/DEAH box helicase family protein [Candidatus Delongbacteria bacterium]
MNEAQTEFEYIDPALKEAGWGVVEGSKIRKQHPISQGRLLGQGRRSQPLKADYVLQYKNRYLAVVEAKARDIYYTDGVGQAKDYADRMNVRFSYSTNGLKIYQIDMDKGVEGDVKKFPSPDELWNYTYPPAISDRQAESDSWKERLFSVPFEDKSGTWQLRYYQDNAITKTLEAIAEGKDRILLTLATGTGKTAIAFQIAWKLFHAKWNINRDGKRSPRILFLADRNILADQAFNSFNAFEEDALVRIKPSEIKKKGKVPKNGSIFFTIFQSFMSGPEDTPHFGQYPEDYFDFIVIDECHRGGANDESNWRKIMEYFSPAVQLGLTATPKRDVNTDTYEYFGKPVYIYSLKEGINDGFLTPFRVKEINTTIDEYEYTSDDDVETGEVDVEKKYTEKDFNKIIEIKEREAYRVKLFMDMIDQKQKTLVFCSTQIHALAVRDLINQYASSINPNYCHRVTADDGGIGEQHLRDFQDNEKSIPTILTTSRKLSTGVDAPEVRNIVLMRPVKSMVEFKQIVGRGTRLFDGKDYYTIYDFVEAHDHFKDPAWDGPPLDPPEYDRKEKDPCPVCGYKRCICGKEENAGYCPKCNNDPCVCDEPKEKMIKVTLPDYKVREFDSMIKTSFYSPEGKPVSSDEFIKILFGDIPKFFKNEEELRKLWSLPDTRKKLLQELSDKGYSAVQLEDLKKIVHGEDSDLYDVLSYVAYHSQLVPRLERASKARLYLNDYNPEQQVFLNFVLEQYVATGVSELDDAKLADLLILKYKALHDAKEELGDIPSIRKTFIQFQKHLYEHKVG